MSIGKRIKQRRKELNITQVQLAEKIGKAARTIQDYEADKALPPTNVIKQIAQVLFIEPGYLAYGQPISNQSTQNSIAEYKDECINKFIKALEEQYIKYKINKSEKIEDITITITLPYNGASSKIDYKQNDNLTATINYNDILQINTQTNVFFIYSVEQKIREIITTTQKEQS